jgi:hypothetical protein
MREQSLRFFSLAETSPRDTKGVCSLRSRFATLRVVVPIVMWPDRLLDTDWSNLNRSPRDQIVIGFISYLVIKERQHR